MTADTFDDAGPIDRLLRRVVHIERGETSALLLSFAYFFLVLAAYYVVRPVRDEMGVALGREALERLFTLVFLIMLAAVPLYGWIVSHVPRMAVVPLLYGFFVANLAGFWLALSSGVPQQSLAAVFYTWASVFNLFVVSLFWVTMSDLWSNAQAKRLYGFIAAGGSAGALAGPLLTQALVGVLGANALLLVSATLLAMAGVCAILLRRLLAASSAEGQRQEQLPVGRDILAGAVEVWRSPYLFRIALWILLANLVSTFFYIEQSAIVGTALADRAERVKLFARIDLVVGVLQILAGMFLTGRVLERFGVTFTISVLPVWAAAGLIAVAVSPTLAVIVTVLAIDRAIAFGLANPAFKVLYTVVGQEEKYKAQSFIDTVVYRGGDAASGWMIRGLSSGLGFAMPIVAMLTVPLAVAWLWVGIGLGKRQAEMAKGER